MASDIDIVNLALSHLGEAATVTSLNPPEGSAQARHAQRFYPIARRALLERRAWNFAVKREALQALADTAAGWDYVYAAPSTMLRPLAVYDPDNGEDISNPVEFDTEVKSDGTIVILTDLEDAELRYIYDADAPERYSPLFVTAFSWLLASYLAGPVVKGESGANVARTCYEVFLRELGEAAASSANASQQDTERTVPWIGAR